MAKAMTALELAARVKTEYPGDWIVENARRAVGLAARHGTTHIRAFADVDNKAGPDGREAFPQVRDEWRGRVELGLVTDPHPGPLHARLADLIEQEVIICLDQNDISDAYYPFGRNHWLEVAVPAAYMLWMTRAGMDRLYDMITTHAAWAIGLSDFGLSIGAPANLVVLDAPNVLEALRDHVAPRHVISQGRLLEAER